MIHTGSCIVVCYVTASSLLRIIVASKRRLSDTCVNYYNVPLFKLEDVMTMWRRIFYSSILLPTPQPCLPMSSFISEAEAAMKLKSYCNEKCSTPPYLRTVGQLDHQMYYGGFWALIDYFLWICTCLITIYDISRQHGVMILSAGTVSVASRSSRQLCN